jgi:riboflavin kinase/FMN adenylyltransferase
MQLLRSIDDLPAELTGGAVTIGNFDGVHRGHARIVERLVAKARAVGGPSIVFTFDPHPVRLLRPDKAPPPLTWTDRKAELLAELGATAVVAYPTDEALLALSPAEFFDRVVRQGLAARAIVEGPNFFFGRERAGNIEVLGELCTASGVALEIVEPLTLGSEYVSSSRVRREVAAGNVDEARRLLTRPYRIRGMVTHGARRGNKIGFPTANVSAIDTLLPAIGVYAGRAICRAAARDTEIWPAAINIGPNPTFGEDLLKVEVHLIGFAGSLYGEPLEVDFLARLRGTQPFASVAELQAQLARDVAAAREIAGQSGPLTP